LIGSTYFEIYAEIPEMLRIEIPVVKFWVKNIGKTMKFGLILFITNKMRT